MADRPTTSKANKALIRRFVHEVFEESKLQAIDELVADGFVSHTWPSKGDGKADLKAATERIAQALSDPDFTIEDMIAEEDRVAVRLTASATQVGEFMGMAASGRRYTVGEIHVFRVVDGKITEHWHQLDAMGMMSQLKGKDSASPA
jgi:steroid delta-isomerase-like uncharacterized protein